MNPPITDNSLVSGGGNAASPESVRPNRAYITDWLFRNLTLVFALSTVLLIFGIAFALFWISRPAIQHMGVSFFTTTTWDPVAASEDKKVGDLYGVVPFVYGTLVTSVIAMLFAIPLGLGAAIFLAEVAPRWLSTPISFVVELLAAVPSIVYGFAALQFFVPVFRDKVENWLNASFGQIPFFSLPNTGISGQDFIVAGAILAIMILPFVTAVARDVMQTVPSSQREAAYGLGATRWETISGIVLRYGSSGIIGAAMLALGRAVGETMAVTIVIGNFPAFPTTSDPTSFSLFRPGNTMPSVLANEFPSPNSDLHRASLVYVGLTLFAVTILINAAARGLVWLTKMNAGSGGSAGMAAFRVGIGNAGRYLAVGLAALFLLYQVGRDLTTRGAAGFVGAPFLLTLFLLLLALWNRKVPTTPFYLAWRKFTSNFAISLCALSTAIACAALFSLLFFVARDGLSSLNMQFFMRPDPSNPETGGMLHAIVGSGLLLLMASCIGIPVGILGGLYLSEFGNNRLGGWTRFAADLLSGVPSIIIGIFAYMLIVLPTAKAGTPVFGIAGGFALGIMMIPTVMRTTEELVRLIPMSLREGSLALGATHAYTVWKVVLPAARSGIVTGVLLALARVAGETAPLLIAVGTSSLWVTNVKERLPSLPMEIYRLKDLPGDIPLKQSWGAALVLVLLVLVFSIAARFATRDTMKRSA